MENDFTAKTSYSGHVLQNEKYPVQLVIKGKIEGNCPVERRTFSSWVILEFEDVTRFTDASMNVCKIMNIP